MPLLALRGRAYQKGSCILSGRASIYLMTTRTPCSGVAPSGTHKKTDLAYTRPATYPAQRPCLRASLKGGVLSLIRPLHPDNISFALLCALPSALAGIVSASRIATARLVFVIVYSISATPQFHRICAAV